MSKMGIRTLEPSHLCGMLVENRHKVARCSDTSTQTTRGQRFQKWWRFVGMRRQEIVSGKKRLKTLPQLSVGFRGRIAVSLNNSPSTSCQNFENCHCKSQSAKLLSVLAQSGIVSKCSAVKSSTNHKRFRPMTF